MAKSGAGRLAYADLLRVLSVLAVIVLHLSGGWLEASAVGTPNWMILNAWDGLSRWCVPLIFMLSGMFLLDPKKSLSAADFLLRCILRPFVALAAWSVFYALLTGWPGIAALSPQWFFACLRGVLRGGMQAHLWLVYAVIGLHLVSPVLRAFARGASRADFHWFFLLVFVFAMLFPTLLRLRPNAAADLFLNRLQIHLVLGYVGYFVAGYYLKTFALSRAAEFLIYALGIAGAAVTVWGTFLLSLAAGALNPALYGFLTPNVAAMAAAVFVLFRYLLGVSDERSRRKSLEGIGRIAFGVYLAHGVFLHFLRRAGLSAPPVTPAVAIPLMAAAVFVPSCCTAWLISKIPLIGRYLT